MEEHRGISSGLLSEPASSSRKGNCNGLQGRDELGSKRVKLSDQDSGTMGNNWKTVVWWDLDKGGVPVDCPSNQIRQRLQMKLAWEGYGVDIEIRAFIATSKSLSERQRIGLLECGITCKEVGYADKAIQDNIRLWVNKHKDEPHNVVLITGDEGFMDFARLLQQDGHNLILASVSKAHSLSLTQLGTNVSDWRRFILLDDKIDEIMARQLVPNYSKRGNKGKKMNSKQKRKMKEKLAMMSKEEKLEQEEERKNKEERKP